MNSEIWYILIMFSKTIYDTYPIIDNSQNKIKQNLRKLEKFYMSMYFNTV